ncbi:MAG: GntR family transcriptional regulator, partial [Candidatus Thioglobus sp.]|nr:GntR family transcriptional regulator [Candidatus Thioglobus sp.]MBT3745143.1 GntR family transcriptional regulator [Candidatus Thioglobus sp.]MBT4746449.1 GntR family transcriptional regulator [Candidatus Thioglobus sp.]MBT6359461.1 GntR family transcriptional regulator [Candidatus Thioglobus sp.]MBT6752417.1 GntR family transcriptional regulator [Candidatus Thioglobus sp.]
MNKKSTVAEDIAKKLESMILDGILELGDKLPAERMLAEKLG